MQVIARETEEADKVKSVVSQEEAVASKEAAGVKAIKVWICNQHTVMLRLLHNCFFTHVPLHSCQPVRR